jgi:hypothetical protein
LRAASSWSLTPRCQTLAPCLPPAGLPQPPAPAKYGAGHTAAVVMAILSDSFITGPSSASSSSSYLATSCSRTSRGVSVLHAASPHQRTHCSLKEQRAHSSLLLRLAACTSRRAASWSMSIAGRGAICGDARKERRDLSRGRDQTRRCDTNFPRFFPSKVGTRPRYEYI